MRLSPPYLSAIQPYLDHAAAFGERTLPDGCRLLGHIPHVAPEAWFHVIFPPLTDERIRELSRDVGHLLPIDFQAFLREANGISLFAGSFSLYGWQGPLRRQDPGWRAPFSLVTPNRYERPVDAAPNAVQVGSYGSDGSAVWAESEDSDVILCRRGSFTTVKRWPSLLEFLTSECSRMERLYDESGHLLADPSRAKAPSPS